MKLKVASVIVEKVSQCPYHTRGYCMNPESENDLCQMDLSFPPPDDCTLKNYEGNQKTDNSGSEPFVFSFKGKKNTEMSREELLEFIKHQATIFGKLVRVTVEETVQGPSGLMKEENSFGSNPV